MTEEVVSQIVFDVAADSVDQLAHPVPQGSGNERDGDHAGRWPGNAAERVSSAHAIDSNAKQPRHYASRGRRHHDKEQAERNLPTIWAVIRQ
jgi:hypothetical protein